MVQKTALYTVSKINREDKLYGPAHGSTTGDETICGLTLTYGWSIINNTFDGEITCKACLDLLATKIYHEL